MYWIDHCPFFGHQCRFKLDNQWNSQVSLVRPVLGLGCLLYLSCCCLFCSFSSCWRRDGKSQTKLAPGPFAGASNLLTAFCYFYIANQNWSQDGSIIAALSGSCLFLAKTHCIFSFLLPRLGQMKFTSHMSCWYSLPLWKISLPLDLSRGWCSAHWCSTNLTCTWTGAQPAPFLSWGWVMGTILVVF